MPSPVADKATLIRRLSLDLIGLPPTVEEVDAFLADDREGAYERLVERLLHSPHYGERWGRHWLDVARYADSNGYTIDGGRSIWKYRDWVIDAFNRDLPFDQFVIEQIAGDLLPAARTDQIVATGFHRNTMVNEEGGTDDEQFRVEAVVDRVATTGVAFLGLTLGCARCHDHKYDPISQREFYELFAIFNNADEPQLSLPTSEQAEQLRKAEAEIKEVQQQLAEIDAVSSNRQTNWEAELTERLNIDWQVLNATVTSKEGVNLKVLEDSSVLASGSIPQGDLYTVRTPQPTSAITAVKLEALPHDSLPGGGPGLGLDGGFVLSEFSIHSQPSEGEEQLLPFATAHADYSINESPIAHAIDSNPDTAWRVSDAEALGVARTATFVLKEPLPSKEGSELVIKIVHNAITDTAQLGRFRILATGADLEVLKWDPATREALATSKSERSEAQNKLARDAFLKVDPKRAPLVAKIANLTGRKKSIQGQVTNTLVMRERSEPRTTHIHLRGDFLRHGSEVEPDVPDVLRNPESAIERPNRLDFARWLVSAENPLTARVTVNRVWQRYFGRGLVTTENDFGLQGEPPSHPKLLDWLAQQFIDSGWSFRALHRLIVTSATYRQSSEVREELTAADPYNSLLGRQQRLRLQAETIRDVALAASGLLSPRIGGPSVYPPQPEGIYLFTQKKQSWEESAGDSRYRRGMYTHLWRSSPYPFLKTFDAPDATVACTRRPRSNTPLQALTLANDVAFFEIAQGFATRLLSETAENDEERIRIAFRRCLTREPTEEEFAQLSEYLQIQKEHYVDSPEAAAAIASADHPKDVDSPTVAAWTLLARVLLNLDELITRE